MVVSRTFLSSSCANCRLMLIRNFTSIASHSIPSWNLARTRPARAISKQTRFFSEASDGPLERKPRDDQVLEAEPSLDTEIEPPGEESQVGTVPWYLQDAPERDIRPLSERQRIPDLPENPPPLLKPLLQQISVDLGLDDLSLLDLRKLDPPPALGANLLMIIGTARSEKHLHVSADRLCRWLRSNYKLRPDADGLLGRNELKLKLKRKAKRSRMMGTNDDEAGDDGIRTGWVCVDVGVVEGGEGAHVQPEEPKAFVGFGRRTDGVRLVIQMLTEEKRGEIDLEQLWGGILQRGGVLDDVDEDPDNVVYEGPAPNYRAGATVQPRAPMEKRELHTSARQLLDEISVHLKEEPDFGVYLRYGYGDLREVAEMIQEFFAYGEFEKAKDYLAERTQHAPILQNEEWRRFFLQNLRLYLESLPVEQQLRALGHDLTDQHSTSFLRTFHQTLTAFPTQAEAEARIWLYCFARGLQHPGCTTQSLLELHKELQGFGVKLGLDSYVDLIRAILREDSSPTYHGPSQPSLEAALIVLKDMQNLGLPIDETILFELQKATTPSLQENAPPSSIKIDPSTTFDLPSLPMTDVQKRLHLLMMTLDLPLFSETTRILLMDLYAQQHHWHEFWEIWRMSPRHGSPRSSTMYFHMFNMVAQTVNQKGCMCVLRTWIPEMELEAPPVGLKGDVAQAVQSCLRVIDPQFDLEGDLIEGEWLSLWERCEKGLIGRRKRNVDIV